MFMDTDDKVVREFHTPYNTDTIFNGFDITFKAILKTLKRFKVKMLMEHSDFEYTGLVFDNETDDKI